MGHSKLSIYTSIKTMTNIPNVPFVRTLFDVDEQMEPIDTIGIYAPIYLLPYFKRRLSQFFLCTV